MATFPDVLAITPRAPLKLQTPLNLPEGAAVRVTVTPMTPITPMGQKKRKPRKRKYLYPTRTVSWDSLKRLTRHCFARRRRAG